MSTKLSNDRLVIKKLPMANEIYMEALVLLLIDKGIMTRTELFDKIEHVQMSMVKPEDS